MKKKVFLVFGLDALLVAAALLAPAILKCMLSHFPPCWIASLGYLCPACGGTRCANFILGGQFAQAFQVNPYLFGLFWYICALVATLHLAWLFHLKPAEKLLKIMVAPATLIALAAGFAFFGIVRNFI